VRLSSFQITTIIGLLPTERRRPQPLVLELELELDLSQTALTSDLSYSVDYSQLAAEVAFIVQAGRFKLIESAALALCHYLMTPPVDKPLTVAAARVTLSKPEALSGRAIPTVSIGRRSEQIQIREEHQGEATVLGIYETNEVSLLRLQRWPTAAGLPTTGRYTESQEFTINPQTRLQVLRNSTLQGDGQV